MPYIEFNHIVKEYGSGEASIKALDDASFYVEKGELAVILGSSGAGKTTTLNILGGMDTASAGQIIVDGNDITQYNKKQLVGYRRNDIGFVFQFYNLIPVLTVEENITLPIRLDGRKINKERLKELLSTLKLVKRRKHLPSQLSGGQQQRVAIGRALINAPAIILADEPTGNLDTENTRDIMKLLRESNEVYRQTMILITHDREIAMQADRILEIQDGRLVRDEVIR